MKLSVTYNPYRIDTTILVDGKPLAPHERISDELKKNDRLQRWIEPHSEWKGFFEEFYDQYNTKSLDIEFTGTLYDFEDFKQALIDSPCAESKNRLLHINASTCNIITPESKLEELIDFYEELKEKNIEGIDYNNIYSKFNVAMNNEFRIVVVAPMSSGKSTLINAILGHSILPAANEATTAVITEIIDDDTVEGFKVSAYTDFDKKNVLKLAVDSNGDYIFDNYGNVVTSENGQAIKDIQASPEFISRLNSSKSTDDKTGKQTLVSLIQITCDIKAVSSQNLHAVIVDTPGGNNSMNENHEKIMDEAIRDEDGAMILYIFDGTKTETNDSAAILKKIAESIKKSNNGKQSKDRILFVANRMDVKDQEQEEEKYERYIRTSILPMLKKEGIVNPNLFLVSAQGAKLIRTEKSGEKLTKKQRDEKIAFNGTFGDKEYSDLYRLYEYSSISSSVKRQMQKEAENAENSIERIAEINSGVPALEATLCEYIEKYAFVIKITKASNSFIGKIEDYLNDARLREDAASNENRFAELQAEVNNKRRRFETNTQLQELKNRIKSIKFDKSPITAEKTRINKVLSSIWNKNDNSKQQTDSSSTSSRWDRIFNKDAQSSAIKEVNKNNLTENEAKELIQIFSCKIEKILATENEIIEKILNNKIIIPCNDIIKMYQELIKKMESDENFRIGAVSFTKTDKFKEIKNNVKNTDELLEQSKKSVEEEHSRTVKKSGVFGAIGRGLGKLFRRDDWGYETEYYTTVKTVYDLEKIFRNEMAKIKDECSSIIENMTAEAEETVNAAKENTIKNIQQIDTIIKGEYEKWQMELADYDKLKEKIEKTKAEKEWMTEFHSRVIKLLDI